MNVIKDSLRTLLSCRETNLLLFSKHTVFTKIQLTLTYATQTTFLAQNSHPLLTHMAQSHVP